MDGDQPARGAEASAVTAAADQPLVVRADSGPQMGTGHIMRCLALAQVWQEAGGQAHFALAQATAALQERLFGEGMQVHEVTALPGSAEDAAQTIRLARQAPAAWVVVDGYHFGAEYQRAVKEACLHLLFLDDYGHAGHYYADLVLNQNICAQESLYRSRESYARLLLGTRYALLRREFWSWRGWQRQVPELASKILVTLGGSDPDNTTLRVIQALQEVDVEGLEAVVVVGGSNLRQGELQSAVRDSPFAIRLEHNVAHMPELMAWADGAVSAGGSTCWELAFMGLPYLVLELADNQRAVAAGLDAAGVALRLGWHEQVSSQAIAGALVRLLMVKEVRAAMSHRGRQLVDGLGGERVVGQMERYPLSVRPATWDDLELLLRWANDPLARKMSFHSHPISWEEHQHWFARVMGDPDTHLLIVELREADRQIRIGQVRLDPDGTVSISLAPEYRGRRLALPALRTGLACLGKPDHVETFTAYIKPENHPSQKVFAQAGFRLAGWAEVAGEPCLKYVYRLPAGGEAEVPDRGEDHADDR